jgi:hypothetical protein
LEGVRVGRWAVTNIKRGGKNEIQDKRNEKPCPNNLGLNRFKPSLV